MFAAAGPDTVHRRQQIKARHVGECGGGGVHLTQPSAFSVTSDVPTVVEMHVGGAFRTIGKIPSSKVYAAARSACKCTRHQTCNSRCHDLSFAPVPWTSESYAPDLRLTSIPKTSTAPPVPQPLLTFLPLGTLATQYKNTAAAVLKATYTQSSPKSLHLLSQLMFILCKNMSVLSSWQN
jgi:hypothetical protein